MDGFGVGEFASFCGEGLGITFANFQLPVCDGGTWLDTRLHCSDKFREEKGYLDSEVAKEDLLVLFSPPALAGT